MAACHKLFQGVLEARKYHTECVFCRLFQPRQPSLHLQHTRCLSSPCTGFRKPVSFNGRILGSNIWLRQHQDVRVLHASSTGYQSNEQDQNKSGAKTDSEKSLSDDTKDNNEETVPEEKLSVFQRFKKTYKEHGKILICVHVATSCVWFGTFFYAAKEGVDVIPFMEWLGLSDRIINPFRNSSLGDVALAYLMYKLATPARYTVTLGGTNIAIKYLRKKGVMQPADKSSSLRTLARDSKTELKEKGSKVLDKTDELEHKLIEKRASLKRTLKERSSRLLDNQDNLKNKNKKCPDKSSKTNGSDKKS